MRLEGCAIKSMWQIFKSKLLIFQSKANLDVKILFGNITQLIDPSIRKMLERVCLGKRIPNSILVQDLLTIEIKVYF